MPSDAFKTAVILGACGYCWKLMFCPPLKRVESIISGIICAICATGGGLEAIRHIGNAINPPAIDPPAIANQVRQAPALRPDPIQEPQGQGQRAPGPVQRQGQVPPWGGAPIQGPVQRAQGPVQRPRRIEGVNRGRLGFVTPANYTDGEDGTIFYSNYRRNRFVNISSIKKDQEKLKRSKDDQEFCEAMGYFEV